MTIQRLHTNARMSQAVIANGFVFLAGQVASDTAKDVAGQTAEILAKIDALLAESGSDKTKIVQATIWLADHTTFEQMNAVWDAWVPQGNAPARACVESALARPAFTVEIGVVAVA
ncbi:RidA family protein [Diaphorobacter sp. HDW4A]|uniref:RidA family protein n=1 Tax=Diaphorobacter sp. HDW4A TaxID=2714924 RepID=UPI00140933B8|nr:RidA family protein [Diaphorobacter sp. HDW4A]QIL80422.1 RidA family protein [Diaphorobacter sp. HDW4A]